MRRAWLSSAAVLVALAFGVAFGNLSPSALVLLLAGTGAAAVAALGRAERRSARPLVPGRAADEPALPEVILLCGVLAGIAWNARFDPGWNASHDRLPGFRLLLALAGAAALTHRWDSAPRVLVRLRFPVLVATWLALVALVLHADPAPRIDVWDLQQGAARALLDGSDPYAQAYPNTYGPGTPLLSADVLSADGRSIVGFPYPPLTIAVGATTVWLGDVRLALVALTLLAAGGILALGRGRPGAELAATFVLFQPRGVFVMEEAWTEPLVLATVVGLALVLAHDPDRPAPALRAGLAAGLALAAKQYTPLLLVAFLPLAQRRARWTIVALAALVAAATLLPFALWDAEALWRSLVRFHLSQPFRADSLSLAAALHRWTGVRLPSWPGFLLAVLALAAGWRRVRDAGDALGLAALAWLAFLLLAKQAFANYHWLAVGLLAAATAVRCAADDDAVPAPARPRASPVPGA